MYDPVAVYFNLSTCVQIQLTSTQLDVARIGRCKNRKRTAASSSPWKKPSRGFVPFPGRNEASRDELVGMAFAVIVVTLAFDPLFGGAIALGERLRAGVDLLESESLGLDQQFG